LNRWGKDSEHDLALAKLKGTGDGDDYIAVYLADLPTRVARWIVG
jgi:hypothetical protein